MGMISVVIAAANEERALARSLAALVPAAIDGLVQEVIVVDQGSTDGTRIVAEAAGCKLIEGNDSLGQSLRQAAAGAKGRWLLFLRPGTVLDPNWIRQAGDFIDEAPTTPGGEARAAFLIGRRAGRMPLLAELLTALGWLAGLLPRAGGAVLLSAAFYARIGGHGERAEDVARDLARRIGRRRLALLRPPAPGAAY